MLQSKSLGKASRAKGAKTSIKLKPDATPMICASEKVLLRLERKVKKTIDELLLLAIFEPVEACTNDFSGNRRHFHTAVF